jgi:hypothetical protein
MGHGCCSAGLLLAKEARMETWEEPTWEEIRMSAEIGGYQPDGDDRDADPTATLASEPGRAAQED